MGEDLLTLKEIAAELSVNYKTLQSCKERFGEYVLGVPVGRYARYKRSYVDFFQMVFALFDEGYSSNEIKSLLDHGVQLKQDMFIKDWIDEWRRKLDLCASGNEQEDFRIGLTDGMADRLADGPTDSMTGGSSDSLEDGRTDGLKDSLDDCPADCPADGPEDGLPGGLAAAPSDCPADGLTGGLTDGPTDAKAASKSAKLAQLKEELLSELLHLSADRIDRSISEAGQSMEQNMDTALSSTISQANETLTLLYKALHEVHVGLTHLDSRLQKLEQDLGIEAQEQPELQDLDLEQLQISLPGQEDTARQAKEHVSLDHATLDFVRASIRDGKPDREAVSQWVQAQRKAEPGVSYGELAERLNQAGIPTLRGLEGWNRGVVRNLAVRNNGNGGWQ